MACVWGTCHGVPVGDGWCRAEGDWEEAGKGGGLRRGQGAGVTGTRGRTDGDTGNGGMRRREGRWPDGGTGRGRDSGEGKGAERTSASSGKLEKLAMLTPTQHCRVEGFGPRGNDKGK